MVADTGPIGGDLSHEFIILASTGESEVYCHKDYLGLTAPPESIDFDDRAAMEGVFKTWTGAYAATSEKHDAAAFNAIPEADRISARGIEVGHIFYFGTKYSKPMKAVVNGPDGKEHAVHMGSYGIGPSRLAAALIEANHDDAGMIWPEAAAPFDFGVINLKVGDAACDGACSRVIAALGKVGKEALYDDRDERPGAKFATADLIGLPWQVIVGPKGLGEGKVELKNRRSGERESVSVEAAISRLGGA
jgi:prolyl-tRNA synthetase